MGREKQKLLSENDHLEDFEHGDFLRSQHLYHTQECAKKHGIFCRILTSLRLKKRSSDHQKLLSESQEHLPVQQDDQTIQSAKTKKSKKKRKGKKSAEKETASKSKKEPKTLSSARAETSANANGSNNKFARTYEMLDNASHCSDCDTPFEPDPRDNIVQIRTNRPIAEDEIGHPHVYCDNNFGESCIQRTDSNPLIQKQTADTSSTGQAVKQQWNRKRAKKARKRFRRVMRSTWQSLQSATTVTNSFPTPQNIANAVSPTHPR